MRRNESIGLDCDLRITARDPESGEETVLVDTEAGISPDDAEIEIVKKGENNDAQGN